MKFVMAFAHYRVCGSVVEHGSMESEGWGSVPHEDSEFSLSYACEEMTNIFLDVHMSQKAGTFPSSKSGKIYQKCTTPLLPWEGVTVHCKLPSAFFRFTSQVISTHSYSWVKRGTVRVKSLVQEGKVITLARSCTQMCWMMQLSHCTSVVSMILQ